MVDMIPFREEMDDAEKERERKRRVENLKTMQEDSRENYLRRVRANHLWSAHTAFGIPVVIEYGFGTSDRKVLIKEAPVKSHSDSDIESTASEDLMKFTERELESIGKSEFYRRLTQSGAWSRYAGHQKGVVGTTLSENVACSLDFLGTIAEDLVLLFYSSIRPKECNYKDVLEKAMERLTREIDRLSENPELFPTQAVKERFFAQVKYVCQCLDDAHSTSDLCNKALLEFQSVCMEETMQEANHCFRKGLTPWEQFLHNGGPGAGGPRMQKDPTWSTQILPPTASALFSRWVRERNIVRRSQLIENHEPTRVMIRGFVYDIAMSGNIRMMAPRIMPDGVHRIPRNLQPMRYPGLTMPSLWEMQGGLRQSPLNTHDVGAAFLYIKEQKRPGAEKRKRVVRDPVVM